MTQETPVGFVCEKNWLYGVLHLPPRPAARGLLIVVGGPQYRAGSHRQFVLLARALAEAGIPVMRFDYRGMGDSGGTARTFEQIGDDICAAIDEFLRQVPGIDDVVLWGLCDAASAAVFYARTDPRVGGLVLLNPWVRTETGIARAYLRHYYMQRLVDPALWRKIGRGQLNFAAATRSLWEACLTSLGRGRTEPSSHQQDVAAAGRTLGTCAAEALPERMLDGLRSFRGRVLLILSGDDLTASEFKDVVAGSRVWRRLLRSRTIARRDLPGANHTFARREWRDQVAAWTLEWMRSW